MDAKTLERYRRRLIEIERDLVSEVIEIEDELEDATDANADDIEPMDRVQADVLAESLELLDDLEREQMEAAEAALERIEAGTYGRCVDCGREIPGSRLDAVPWAERCEADQERFESEQRAHLERTGGRPRG
jgi:RNA polymerase-binding transcription factor